MAEKKPSDWTEEDLVKHLENADPIESEELEFKSRKLVDGWKPKKVKKALAKGLSAFGNREEGGYFVLGVNEETRKIDGVPVNNHKGNTVEWLDALLKDCTDPVSDWKTHSIYPSGSREPGIPPEHAVYVLAIPPHPKMPIRSTEDHEYYYRSGRSSNPMNQRHLLDFINRPKYPKLRVLGISVPYDYLREDPNNSKQILDLQVTIRNRSNRIAKRAAVELFVPNWMTFETAPGRESAWHRTGPVDQYTSYIHHVGCAVFPRQPVSLIPIRVSFDKHFGNPNHPPYGLLDSFRCIGLILYADDAPPYRWPIHINDMPELPQIIDAYLKRECGGSLSFRGAGLGVPIFDVDLLMKRYLDEQEGPLGDES